LPEASEENRTGQVYDPGACCMKCKQLRVKKVNIVLARLRKGDI
jgi:hypothetical protein